MKSLIDKLLSNKVKFISDKDILTYETSKDDLLTVMNQLKNNSELLFSQLTDLCAVDYSAYGQSEWQTKESTSTGYNRGITPKSNARKQYEDDSDQDKLVNYLKKGSKAVMSAISHRNTVTKDTFMLTGFSDALSELEKRCKLN